MRAPAYVLTMALLVLGALLALHVQVPARAEVLPSGSRPIRYVVMKFRAEYCYWDNGTYSIWEANTSELPNDWLSHEFVCSAENNYEGNTVYTGGIAWVSDPLLADFYVEGDVLVKVWLSSPQSNLMGLMASVGEVDDEGNIYASWNSTIAMGTLPSTPTEYDFTINVDGHVFQEGHRIGFSVVAGSLTPNCTVVAWFGGGSYPASARVPTNSYLDITEVLICHGPSGENRTKFYVDESPVSFEIEVSDPLSNLDVDEVRLLIYNATHTLLDAQAEAITDRSAYETRYLTTWGLDDVSAGDYTAEVRAVDNSGIEVARSFELKIVELHVADWSYAPTELARGLEEEQELAISFSNGGNDVMYAVKLWLLEDAGLEVSPTFCSIGDLGPSDACSIDLSVYVPSGVELGPKQLVFMVAYNDFRGIEHQEQLAANLTITKLRASLRLSLEPPEARVLDNVTVLLELLDHLGQPLAGQEVELYLNGSPLAELVTNETGEAEFSFKAELSAGNHTVSARFPGTYLYEAEEASAVLHLRLRASSIEVLSAPPEVHAGEEASIEVLLRDEDGWPIGGADLSLYLREGDAWRLLAGGETGEDGVAIISFVLEEGGEHELKVAFAGDDVHDGSEEVLHVSCLSPGGPGLPGPSPSGQGWNYAGVAIVVAASAIALALVAIWLRKRRS